jgi:tRNA (guanine-N7-)-methyltransferase
MQSRAVAVARAACVRASGARVRGSRARASRRGAATRSANADPADDAADVASAILKPRSRGKHLDRPWHLTYLRNQGHGTPAQKAALRDLWSTYGVDVQTYAGPAGDDAGSASDEHDPPKRATTTKKSPQKPLPALDFAALFPTLSPLSPVALEIGFGLGDSLVEMASVCPGKRFLGAEVHRPGVGAALIKIHSANIRNAKVVKMDALWLLRDFIPDGSLFDVCVYFPDPWSDTSAHRRIVNPFLLKLCERKMIRGAFSFRDGVETGESLDGDDITERKKKQTRRARLHVCTDDASYAEHVRRVFASAEASGTWRAVPVDPADESYGVDVMPGRSRTTKYELKGTKEGRSTFDACVELL